MGGQIDLLHCLLTQEKARLRKLIVNEAGWVNRRADKAAAAAAGAAAAAAGSS